MKSFLSFFIVILMLRFFLAINQININLSFEGTFSIFKFLFFTTFKFITILFSKEDTSLLLAYLIATLIFKKNPFIINTNLYQPKKFALTSFKTTIFFDQSAIISVFFYTYISIKDLII